MMPRLEQATFHSYSGLFTAHGDLAKPRTLDELRQTVAWAREQGRTLSFSGAGLSFDNQYISSDLVVSLKALSSIRVIPEERAVEVGPGARWGDIVRAALRENLLPYIVVTGEGPTAGGTLSAHTNSVFSPCCGKEGKHVVDFDLLLADGSIVTCSRERNSELFYGAIAGFGSLGAFTRIKYRVLALGEPSRFEGETVPYADIADLETRFRTAPGEGIDDPRNVWAESSLFYIDGATPKFNLYRRRIVPRSGSGERPMLRYLRGLPVVPLIRFMPGYVSRFLARDTRAKQAKQTFGYDQLHSGSFYMHADSLFRQLAGWVGYQVRLYQHSYFIPLRGDQVTRFTQLAARLLTELGLSFAMFDIMYIPRDEPFLLSPSRDEHGFYVNTTFLDAAKREAVMAYYARLTAEAVAMGGRINLAKNAFMPAETIEAMYREPFEALAQLKRRVDPAFTFNSDFLREKLPSVFGARSQKR